MNRKPFTAAVGETYRNQGGGTFICKTQPDQAGGQIMQNTVSKWTFRAQGIGIYEDGSIDWDYSTGGYFQTDDQDQEEEKDVRVCPVCEKEVERADMNFTRDCHGITFRLVCADCYRRLMAKGYDGEYYDEADEQIEADY